MKILFFGTPLFAKNILEYLINNSNFEIIGLTTQEDKPFGRKRELKFPETKEFLLNIKSQIPIFQPNNFKNYDFIKRLNPDVILVVAYGKILPSEIINNFYCINIHASILPKSRGASPIQDMILKNQKLIGISIIRMSERLDDGNILGLRFINNANLDIEEMSNILSSISADFVIKVLNKIDEISPITQIEVDKTYCKKILKSDGMISFNNANEIYLKYLAYKVWPNIFLENGTKLFDISLNDESSRNKSGEIIEIQSDCIIIGCKIGSLKIKTIQSSGKNKVSAPSYLKGKRLNLGDILS